MSFGTYALIVLAGCVSVVLVGGLAAWLINKQEDPGRHFKPVRERPLEPVDAQTVEFMHHLSDRCSDPPEVSCADAGCPVHGGEWHPLDDWDEPVTLNVPQPGSAGTPESRELFGLGHLITRIVRREGIGAQGEPATGPSLLPRANTLPPRPQVAKAVSNIPGKFQDHRGPGHSLVLFRRDRTVPFHTAGRLQEACQTAALIAYAESILTGASA